MRKGEEVKNRKERRGRQGEGWSTLNRAGGHQGITNRILILGTSAWGGEEEGGEGGVNHVPIAGEKRIGAARGDWEFHISFSGLKVFATP